MPHLLSYWQGTDTSGAAIHLPWNALLFSEQAPVVASWFCAREFLTPTTFRQIYMTK